MITLESATGYLLETAGFLRPARDFAGAIRREVPRHFADET
jgi:hypothetical protein